MIKPGNFENCVIDTLIRDSVFYGYVSALLQVSEKSINEIARDFCDHYYPDEEPKNITRAYYFYIEKIRK